MVVSSGSVEKVTTADEPYEGAKVGDLYIKLVIANAQNPLYIPVKDLVEYVTSGSKSDDMVVITIDGNHKVTASITDGKITTAKLGDGIVTTAKIASKAVTEAKLADAVTQKLNKEWQPVGNYKTTQTAVTNKASATKIITSLTQNTNGVISYSVTNLTPDVIGAAPDGHGLDKGTDTTAAKSLSFGESFTAVTDTSVSGHTITDTTTTYTLPDDRLFSMLVPDGTSIQANEDLKTVAYLKAGRYYCTKNETVGTLKNCPTKKAFIMEVLSPISKTVDNETTGTWIYRLRKITTIDGTQYTQFVHSDGTAGNFTYDSWKIIPGRVITGSSEALGDKDTPIYINSSGNFVEGNKKADFASYQHDDSGVAMRLSNSNEISFKSSTDYVYFGYANRLEDSKPIHTYKFGTHSGSNGASNGTIECGKVTMGGVSM
jgi:hypothetical protein